ncbi:MAG TPA: universal stress protein [Gammaproteobacteria bacterium]
MTLQRLLAATDLSIMARHAAARAALLTRQQQARLDLLHVIDHEPLDRLRQLLGESFTAVEQTLCDNALVEMQELAEWLYHQYGVNAGVQVSVGAILDTLYERADACAADLLVAGVRGASFLRHTLLGSTAERMVRKTRQPILVVKQPPHDHYRHVLVPIDFSDVSRRALNLARALAPDAVLILLHVFDVPFESKLYMAGVEDELIERYRVMERQESLGKMHQLADVAGLAPESFTLLAQRGEPWLNILEQEQEFDIDLIVLGKHGTGRIEELLLGSVTKHVLAQSRCDVLIVV